MQAQKQHAACDQCRRRKLKCPGEQPRCSRCQDEQISCHYSMRKTMGRPRKRRREDHEQLEVAQPEVSSGTSNTEPDLADFWLPDFSSWVLPPANVAENHDDNMPNLLQQNLIPGAVDSSLQNNGFHTEWDSGQRGFPPSPFSMHDGENEPVMQGDIVQDSISIGEFYAARDAEADGGEPSEPCACLTSMYLAASNLETCRNAGFPTALTPLKAAMQTAKTILLCRKCPTEVASGCQNVMLLNSLLNSIAMGFHKLLQNVENETARAAAASEMKILDVGDRSASNAHLHTGTPDCPGRFSMELEPEEWCKLTKRVIKKNIWANDDSVLTLDRLCQALEARQKAWHSVKHLRSGHVHYTDPSSEKDFNCLRLTAQVRRVMSTLPQ